MIRLEKSEVLQRPLRKEDTVEEMGIASMSKALEAIDANQLSQAKEWVKYVWLETKGLHDLYADWVWALLDYIAKRLGEEELFDAHVKTQLYLRPFLLQHQSLSREDFVRLCLEMQRAHRCGPDQLGTTTVRDEGDRYVVELDPCGSGGRMRRGDPVAGTPPRTESPYNLGVVKGAYPWTWGKHGVAIYCIHCPVGEIVSIETIGYPFRIMECPDDPSQPCRMIVYKDPRNIPEHYYTRVGKTKPKNL